MNEGNEFYTPELDLLLAGEFQRSSVAKLPDGVDQSVIDARFKAALLRIAERVAVDGFPRKVRKYSWLPVSVVR